MPFKGRIFIWRDRKRFLGMPLSFTRYALSEDRLFLSVGFFTVRDEEILLYRVRDISSRRSLGQRIFGVGTVVVSSSDKSTPELELKNIRHPMEVKELIHKSVEEIKIRRRVRVGEVMTSNFSGDDEDPDPDDFDDDDISN